MKGSFQPEFPRYRHCDHRIGRDLASGVYFYKINSGKQQVAYGKLVVQKFIIHHFFLVKQKALHSHEGLSAFGFLHKKKDDHNHSPEGI